MRRAELSSRSTLHISRLAQYTAFCASKGWAQEPCKGDYEVLRMRHPLVKEPLLVYRSDKAGREHYTTYGQSAQMLAAFLHGGERRTEERPVAITESSDTPPWE